MAAHIDVECLSERTGADVLDLRRRSCNAGIINEYVEAAERRSNIRKQAGHLVRFRHVDDAGVKSGKSFAGLLQRSFIDIADPDPRTSSKERLRNDETDSGATSGHERLLPGEVDGQEGMIGIRGHRPVLPAGGSSSGVQYHH